MNRNKINKRTYNAIERQKKREMQRIKRTIKYVSGIGRFSIETNILYFENKKQLIDMGFKVSHDEDKFTIDWSDIVYDPE